jgi:CVNH domain
MSRPEKDGTLNSTALAFTGISNQNGDLTQGTGASSFQKSCGNIRIDVDFRNVTLLAFCRRINGTFEQTSLPLNNISNNDGRLTQP